jgi:hypothetical protein
LIPSNGSYCALQRHFQADQALVGRFTWDQVRAGCPWDVPRAEYRCEIYRMHNISNRISKGVKGLETYAKVISEGDQILNPGQEGFPLGAQTFKNLGKRFLQKGIRPKTLVKRGLLWAHIELKGPGQEYFPGGWYRIFLGVWQDKRICSTPFILQKLAWVGGFLPTRDCFHKPVLS